MSSVSAISLDHPALLVERPDFIILSHPRSGTHFLQESLASHPGVHGRGECVLRLLRKGPCLEPLSTSDPGFLFRNKPECMNGAIVMYRELPLFESICGSLDEVKVIHLLRRPEAVAASVMRAAARKALLQSEYRAHYTIDEEATLLPAPPPAAPSLIEAISRDQRTHRARLEWHAKLLEITYEEITGDCQVNRLPDAIACRLLAFIGLPAAVLTNRLRKSDDRPQG